VVHEALAAEPGDLVNFDDVADRIIQLIRDLAPAYAAGESGPSIRRTGSCGMLPTDLAMPMAMAAAEALQNAVEHAAAEHIQLDLSGGVEPTSEGNLVATARIVDDGLGLPGEFTPGLGLQIVHSLVEEQCRGRVTVANGAQGGVVVALEIPLP
ncbi:MAG: ATP-binding protein, partial [Actinomycetales bacterium]